MKVRACFVQEFVLADDVRSQIETEIRAHAPDADPAPLLADIERMMGYDLCSCELEDEPTKKQLTRYAEKMQTHTGALFKLIGDAPPAMFDAMERHARGVHELFDELESHLCNLELLCYQVASEKGRPGASRSSTRFVWLGIQLAQSLRAIGIEPDTGEANPFKAILATMVQQADPQRTEPDVGRYATRALQAISEFGQKTAQFLPTGP